MSEQKNNIQPKISETSVMPDNKLLIEIALKKRLAHLIQKLHQGSLSQGEIKELKQLGGPALPAGCVWTQKEIAEAFNVSLRAIGNWVSKEMPKEPEGYYNLVKICYWKMADEADKTSEEDWGKINKKYQALIHELEYRQLSKKLISREEVDTIFRNRLISLVRSFGALPREIAPAMEGMSIREKEAYLTERIEDIRNQFAEPILEDEEDEEDNGESQEERQDELGQRTQGNLESPAEDHSQPVE